MSKSAATARRCVSSALRKPATRQPSQLLCLHQRCQTRKSSTYPASGSPKSDHRTTRSYVASLLVASGLLGGFAINSQTAFAEAPAKKKSKDKRDDKKDGPKLIRIDEVKKHGSKAERKWVIRGTRVYDITDWIPAHPGGDVILRAVGSNIDAYWNIFSIHKNKEVYEILESYFIGELDPQDLDENGTVPQDDIEDPFAQDPKRDPALIVHTPKPCNAEAPVQALKTFITPNHLFYVRQHLWVPPCTDPDAHKLHIELHDGTEAEYTLKELKEKFDPVTITATLQCSGNRRAHMTNEARSAQGLQWDVGAISNAEWTGVRLRDVLKDAGFDVNEYDPEEVKHCQFAGSEAYGSSIPIEKAVSRQGDVLLVHTMNGQPIPPDHGYPLRLLAPGHVAARSVKWLSKIILSDEESTSQWQRKDYKCFGPNESGGKVDWDNAPAIQEMPVQSAITSLREVSCHDTAGRKQLSVYGLEEDAVEVEGYAFSGAGRKIVRVDVSADDGKSWHQADILPNESKGSKQWSWTKWRWAIPRGMAGRVFVCKAVDEGYNTQPDSYESHWNFKGNLTSSWHRVGFSNRRT